MPPPVYPAQAPKPISQPALSYPAAPPPQEHASAGGADESASRQQYAPSSSSAAPHGGMFAGAPGAYGMPYGMPPSGMFAGPYGPPPGAFGPPPGAFGPPPGAFRPPPGAYGAPPPPGAFGPPQGAFGPPHDAHGAQEAGPVHLPKRVKPREDKDAIFKSKQPAVIRAAAGKVWADPKLAEWDPHDYRLFCGDLGPEITDHALAEAFSKYRSFQKARVIMDNKKHKSRGYGFVSFKDVDDYTRAFREMNGKYLGSRPLNLRRSNTESRTVTKTAAKKLIKSGKFSVDG